MALKDLLKRVTANVVIDESGKVQTGRQTFRGVTYGLTTLQPKQSDLRAILQKIINTIDGNISGGLDELTDQQKKEFLLIFYQLAFAQESRATGCFHPSEISIETSWCHRKMYYQKARAPKDPGFMSFTEKDNRMQRLCDLGTLKHLYVQANLRNAGILIDLESPVSDPRIGIEGKADGEVNFFGDDDLGNFYDEPMILEVKTINGFGFNKLRKPKPEHIKQASIYGAILKYKHICFLYYNKDNSELKVYVAKVDYHYFESFEIVAEEIVRMYNMNVRRTRSTDISKHNVPKGVCGNMTNARAMECPYRDRCFKS